ncbi:hypothetical protein SUGI_1145010 [Cryptomeria japonica]|nr:hypothetical protein SUGI_1145010 [Cryptomeria japonica]
MGNTCSFNSSSPLSQAYPARTYQVFISHRGEDTKQNIASHLYHNLKRRRYSVFLDKYSIRGGEPIKESIKHAIRSALVHVVIFSPRFAESEWCLDELSWMLKTRAPIVPVFWGVEPSEVSMKEEDGTYVRAFQMHKQAGKFNTQTLKKWEEALHNVSDRKGFIYDGDQGEKLEEIAGCVIHHIKKIMRISAKTSQRISWRKWLGVSSTSLKKMRIAAKALQRIR